jgi:DUF2997 family protein
VHKQDIEIVIKPNGEVTFQVKGVKGASCLDETKFLEAALGGEVVEQEKTGEYYEQSESYASATVGEGNEE